MDAGQATVPRMVDPAGPRPEISVVVASHDRPLRLRWLLNALEEQTLTARALGGRRRPRLARARDRRSCCATHPLARAGVLRHVTLPPGSAPAGRQPQRGAGAWPRAPLVAFTDDDCRPPADWLERALAAARRHPGAIVQGATRPDPDETSLGTRAAPRARRTITPPVPWAQTCNIVYPRALLERVGGFDEEDAASARTPTSPCARARPAPTYVGAPEVLTYHAVRGASPRRRPARRLALAGPAAPGQAPPARCAASSRWGSSGSARHAWLRARRWRRWSRAPAARRRPLLVVPWVVARAARLRPQPARAPARARRAAGAASRWTLAEVAALACGSVEHRTLLL